MAEKTTFNDVVATDVAFEDYLAHYAADYYEWSDGMVIKMSPIHDRHDELTRFLAIFFESYFEQKPIGTVRQQPFVMKLPAIRVAREPDLQIILQANPHPYTPTFMNGPTDIVIEVVSPESVERDYEDKFKEYQKGGVPEYWIFDPMQFASRFYLLVDGKYQHQDVTENYRTPRLPMLMLHIPTLWERPLPGPLATALKIQEMLAAE